MNVNPFVPGCALLFVIMLGAWLSGGISTVIKHLQAGEARSPDFYFGGVILPLLFFAYLAVFCGVSYVLYRRDRNEMVSFLRNVLSTPTDR
jgi:hypothetical protein